MPVDDIPKELDVASRASAALEGLCAGSLPYTIPPQWRPHLRAVLANTQTNLTKYIDRCEAAWRQENV